YPAYRYTADSGRPLLWRLRLVDNYCRLRPIIPFGGDSGQRNAEARLVQAQPMAEMIGRRAVSWRT
ncbi:MAG: hypothetical protein Q8O57_10760, partial [Kiritimatiellota bacterium]|nr:hypothetical protein [Kiritimatiellota bacterium]